MFPFSLRSLSSALATFLAAVSFTSSAQGALFEDAIIMGREEKDPRITLSTVLVLADQGEESNCTGSLLTPNLVLTAAHCVVKNGTEIPLASSRLMVLFTTYYDGQGDFSKIPQEKIDSFIIHPEYDDREADDAGNPHDLALLKLSSPAPAPYRPADVLPRGVNLGTGTPVIVAGYGDTSSLKSDDDFLLRSVSLLISRFNSGSTLMTLNGKKPSGIGKGDSGGPAFTELDNRLWLIGVCSSSMHSGTTAFYENVTRYRDWLVRSAATLGVRLPLL